MKVKLKLFEKPHTNTAPPSHQFATLRGGAISMLLMSSWEYQQRHSNSACKERLHCIAWSILVTFIIYVISEERGPVIHWHKNIISNGVTAVRRKYGNFQHSEWLNHFELHLQSSTTEVFSFVRFLQFMHYMYIIKTNYFYWLHPVACITIKMVLKP
jgi:hypothetical protein